jgi:alpha-tubulin suppressor-like RCC1 family protein
MSATPWPSVNAVDGIATFADLSLDLPGEGFVLQARSAGMRSGASAEFSVKLTVVEQSAGGEYTCGVTVVRFSYCWGWNADGQLADGTTDQRLMPTPTQRDLRFVQVSAGFAHTCGVTTDRVAYCWGWDEKGQLGDGTTSSKPTPVRVVQ